VTIAFLGHSYHQRTASSGFMQDILREAYGAMDCFFDDSWAGGIALDVATIAARGYDHIHIWQMESLASAVAAAAPAVPVTFYPMLDSARMAKDDFWRRIAGHMRIVCFSRTLHLQMLRRGLESACFEYMPDPASQVPVEDPEPESLFFWQRRRDLGWPEVRRLLPQGFAGRVHLHMHLDPTYGTPEPPPAGEIARYRITTSTWFEDRAELDALTRRFAGYIAPRLHEGIGMSFLEAMARGQCVIAADNPTMSEYITHGVNGLLFAPREPAPLDLSRMRAIGRRAREGIEAGFERWERDRRGRLIDYIDAPRGADTTLLREASLAMIA
jgi:hypothetical protein